MLKVCSIIYYSGVFPSETQAEIKGTKYLPLIVLPMYPSPPKGFQDLIPLKSQFVSKVVLKFVFLNSPVFLYMCRPQSTQCYANIQQPCLGAVPSRTTSLPFPRWQFLLILQNLVQMSLPPLPSLMVPGSESPLSLLSHHPFYIPRSHAFSVGPILSPRGQKFILYSFNV